MKKPKGKIKEALLDMLLEIIIGAVFFGIGAVIVSIFGIGLIKTDPELIMLIGIVVFFVVFFLAYTLIQRIKKKSRSNKTTNQEEEKNEK